MSLSGNSTSSFATSNSLNETFSNTSAGSSGMSKKEIAILMPIYSISLLAALIGNFLIIVVFYMYKPIKKNMNYFVVNMAISDLFTPLTIMPFKIAETLSNGTFLSQLPSSLSEVLCKLCYCSCLPLADKAHLEEGAFHLYLDVMGCGHFCPYTVSCHLRF